MYTGTHGQGESNCCGAPVYDPGNTGEGICTECYEHCGYQPLCEPTFYMSVKCDYPKVGKFNQTIDIVERGLDQQCGGDQNGTVVPGQGHQWLLIPPIKGQKEYIFCLRCMEIGHL